PKRGIHALDSECGDDVKLWGPTARIFASFLAPGVAAARALKEIERLACWTAKQANVTSQLLSDLLVDVSGIRHAVLQNRAAIDFLLLAQGHGCQDVEGMCCFNLSDHSESMHKQLAWLQDHTKKIGIQDDPFGNWLGSIFGGIGPWIKQLLKVLVIGLILFLALLICIPCIIQCLQGCIRRMVTGIFEERREQE
ncbi:syncytin-A-like, partial [Coturnix japonica]|uniref:syncytin-A-like n=1 Tax=Coturnix japonica TaxID=93934 RepID=UPI0013A5F279